MIETKGKVRNSTKPTYEASLRNCSSYSVPHSCGPCNVACSKCQALHFKDEATLGERDKANPSFSTCCQKDKVTLPLVDNSAREYPTFMKILLTARDQSSKNYQSLLRMYNNALSFTSLGANVDHSVQGPFGINVFKISGALTHRISSIEPPAGAEPGFAQIYVVGDKGLGEAEYRASKAKGKSGNSGRGSLMEPGLILKLVQYLNANNPYAKVFRSARDILQSRNALTLKLQGVPKAGSDPKRYNCPTANEVAIVVQGAGNIIKPRQILLHRRDNGLECISDMHSSYFPMRYPIFFPFGEQQWDNLFCASTQRVKKRKVGPLEWFAFMLFKRSSRFSAILAGKSLLQEILVDMCVCVERQRLKFITNNQEKLKVGTYNRLLKSLENQSNIVGRCVILPATFIGSPRGMEQLYHDAMAITRKFGPPSLFITMTANPKWPEVLAEIPEGDNPVDHPTIVTRVFYLKMCYLLFVLIKMDRLGRVVAYVFTVEFQKRGLPHLHLMLTLDERDRPTTPEAIDEIVSAEIPDPVASPILHALVCEFMLHGPCQNRPCWNGKSCKIGFPKPFSERTINIDGTYPVYLRRDSGRTFTKHTTTFDNGSVVPYSPYLTRAFCCHINVEVPASSSAIKYLYKYITKGHDRLAMSLESNNEVQSYIDGQYISPPEACWRLFKYPLSGRSPAVTRLNIHDQDEQLVYFDGKEGLEGQINSGKATQTTLTQFLKLNQDDAVGADGRRATSLFYEEIPAYFSWNKANKEWVPRKTRADVVGRLFSVSYLAGEKYYMRVLLLHCKGMTSHQDMRTVGGTVCDSYRSACDQLGLLVNDFLYDEALQEASIVQSGYQLTMYFALICVHSPPANPKILFEKHFKNFTDDCCRIDMSKRYLRQLDDHERRVLALFHLRGLLEGMGSSLLSCGLKTTKKQRRLLATIEAEKRGDEDPAILAKRLNNNLRTFNSKQSEFYSAVDDVMKKQIPKCFYLDGPGGTGKTFLLNTIIDKASLSRTKVIVVASSGVAALLLTNGQTAHSAFKIPIDTPDYSECPIEAGTTLADHIRDTRLIIWDEIVAIHKNAISAVDKTLRRLCDSDMAFGGKVVIFSGDFRQILPVVKYNEFPSAQQATIKSSGIWPTITPYHLSENMRLARALSGPIETRLKNIAFSRALLALGEGEKQEKDFSLIDLEGMNVKSFTTQAEMRSNLISFVYGDIQSYTNSHQSSAVDYLNERCILAPLNRDVRKINSEILGMCPGQSILIKSLDTPDPDSFGSLPEECLNKISISGFPEHEIEIKVGMPLVVIRNMAIEKGLCNGSRIVVDDVSGSYIIGRLMAGPFSGNVVTLPRTKLHNKAGGRSGLSFFRYQYPVAPAYAMSVNKSQGQTLRRVGVYLETDVFSHGQLYVAVLRVSNVDDLLVVKPANRSGIMNVVHKSIFQA